MPVSHHVWFGSRRANVHAMVCSANMTPFRVQYNYCDHDALLRGRFAADGFITPTTGLPSPSL